MSDIVEKLGKAVETLLEEGYTTGASFIGSSHHAAKLREALYDARRESKAADKKAAE